MVLIDIVAAMAEKVRNAEEGTRNSFQNMMNVFLMRGLGTSSKRIVGASVRVGVEPLEIL